MASHHYVLVYAWQESLLVQISVHTMNIHNVSLQHVVIYVWLQRTSV